MPRAIGRVSPTVKKFNKKIESMRNSFPGYEVKLYRSHSFVEDERLHGKLDAEMQKGLKKMATDNLKRLKSIREIMDEDPKLKVPRDVAVMFYFVIANAQILAGRIEDIREDTKPLLPMAGILENPDDLLEGSSWDPDPRSLLGKKI